jgi:hypothetical protein
MPYGPNYPSASAPLRSAPMREQLQALKALVDAAAQAAEPIGTIKAWARDFPNTPPLSAHWLECNGQTVNDPASPYHGQALPDLNANGLFLRGGTASGSVGGQDYFGTAAADNSGIGTPFAAVTTDFSPGALPFPPHYTVVWIMRVK